MDLFPPPPPPSGSFSPSPLKDIFRRTRPYGPFPSLPIPFASFPSPPPGHRPLYSIGPNRNVSQYQISLCGCARHSADFFSSSLYQVFTAVIGLRFPCPRRCSPEYISFPGFLIPSTSVILPSRQGALPSAANPLPFLLPQVNDPPF